MMTMMTINDDNDDMTMQERLTAKEAMAHKYFDPVRADIEKEMQAEKERRECAEESLAKRRKTTDANFE